MGPASCTPRPRDFTSLAPELLSATSAPLPTSPTSTLFPRVNVESKPKATLSVARLGQAPQSRVAWLGRRGSRVSSPPLPSSPSPRIPPKTLLETWAPGERAGACGGAGESGRACGCGGLWGCAPSAGAGREQAAPGSQPPRSRATPRLGRAPLPRALGSGRRARGRDGGLLEAPGAGEGYSAPGWFLGTPPTTTRLGANQEAEGGDGAPGSKTGRVACTPALTDARAPAVGAEKVGGHSLQTLVPAGWGGGWWGKKM